MTSIKMKSGLGFKKGKLTKEKMIPVEEWQLRKLLKGHIQAQQHTRRRRNWKEETFVTSNPSSLQGWPCPHPATPAGQVWTKRAASTQKRSQPPGPPPPRDPSTTRGGGPGWTAGYLARPRWPRSPTGGTCSRGAISGRAARASPHPPESTFSSSTGGRYAPSGPRPAPRLACHLARAAPPQPASGGAGTISLARLRQMGPPNLHPLPSSLGLEQPSGVKSENNAKPARLLGNVVRVAPPLLDRVLWLVADEPPAAPPAPVSMATAPLLFLRPLHPHQQDPAPSFRPAWPELERKVDVGGSDDAKVTQKLGRGKEATVRKANKLQKEQRKVGRSGGCPVPGEGASTTAARLFPSLIQEGARQKHGIHFPNSGYNLRLCCSFIISSVEELAWTPVHWGLDSLDWSWIWVWKNPSRIYRESKNQGMWP